MKQLDSSSLSDATLLVKYRFVVVFLPTIKGGKLLPYPADIRFQKVSGLKSTVNTEVKTQGGDNDSIYHLPNNISYANLTLKNGRTVLSANFSVEISRLFSSLSFTPTDVLIMSINHRGIVLSAWLAQSAYPIEWSVSELDADSNGVIIDSLVLAYRNLSSIVI